MVDPALTVGVPSRVNARECVNTCGSRAANCASYASWVRVGVGWLVPLLVYGLMYTLFAVLALK